MGVSVFLSRATPHRVRQKQFLEALCRYLADRGLEERTVGETDFGISGLEAIRFVMMQSNGLVSVAFRRLLVRDGEDRPDRDEECSKAQRLPLEPNTWLTTPYCHIESAMAYELGLPILVLVEKGVRLDGVLEAGALVQYPPEFDLDNDERAYGEIEKFFDDGRKWKELAATWEGQVREVLRNRARRPALYGC